MNQKGKKMVALLIATQMLTGSLYVGSTAIAAPAPITGTPYQVDGNYDVNVKHIVINQVYGGGTDPNDQGTYASNGFIELYNPTDSDISLEGWSLHYAYAKDAKTGVSENWIQLNLKNTIKAHSSYLVIGASTIKPEDVISPFPPSHDVSTKYDQKLIDENGHDVYIHNKGLKVVLLSNTNSLNTANPFSPTMVAGYVDMLGTAGNSDGNKIDGYETAYSTGKDASNSKKIGLRRVGFSDSDNNKTDFELIDYSAASLNGKGPRYSGDLAWGQAAPELGIATKELANANVGSPYSVTTSVYGGTLPYIYTATGLPAGLTINQDGRITGTPTTEGISSVTLTVTDSANPSVVANKAFTLTVQPPQIADKLSVEKISQYTVGTSSKDGGVAEIVKYNKDNGKMYIVNGASNPPSVDIVALTTDAILTKEKSILIKQLSETDGFVYGDLTSIDINTLTKRVVVAIQEADSMKKGKILMLDYDGNLLKTYETGVQPDMVKFTSDGKYILTADEAEPRTAAGDPEGSVTIIDTLTHVSTLVKFDNPAVIDDLVHIRGASDPATGKITGSGPKTDAVFDLEPEYIALNANEKKAYIALQENNAIAIIDIASKSVDVVKGLGYKDFNQPKNALDLVKDGLIHLENVPFFGMYMPDGIASYSLNGKQYLFTANEGDATEWPADSDNPTRINATTISKIRGGLNPESAAATFLAGKTAYDKVEVVSDMGNDGIYMYGGRSFSVWDADTMSQVYDSGSDFETITSQRLPDYFNASNSKTEKDDRSAKKGPEPEYVTVGQVGSKAFAFVGLERIGGVMTYDVTNPENPVFANYINTRDFSKGLDTDTGPEGLEFIPATSSPTGLPLLLVANEVGGTIAALQMNITKVTLDKTALSFIPNGAGAQLTADITPVGGTDRTVTWTSSNSSVAQVDAYGFVKPGSIEGTAVITVHSADGYGIAEAIATVKAAGSTGDGYIPPVKPDQPDTGKNVLSEKALTVTKGTNADGQAVNQVTVNAEELKAVLTAAVAAAGAGKQAEVNITMPSLQGATTVTLPAAALIRGNGKDTPVSINIETGDAVYTLPLNSLNLPNDGTVSVRVSITPVPNTTLKTLENQANAIGAELAGNMALEFQVFLISGSQEKEWTDFGSTYISRAIYIPASANGTNVSAVMVDPTTGELIFVPHVRTTLNGKAAVEMKRPGNSIYTLIQFNKTFKDLNGHWAKAEVEAMASKLIIKGVNDDDFAPEKAITRAEFTSLLVRSLGLAAGKGSTAFQDVAPSAWYAGSIETAVHFGLVNGISPVEFAPNDSITRAQMAVMIAHAMEMVDATNLSAGKTESLNKFSDSASIPKWASAQAALLADKGIMLGDTKGAFAPSNNATRAQAAVILQRTLKQLNFSN